MMRRRSILLAAGLPLLMVSATASAQHGDPLEASSPWNIDYADDFCRLQRLFGTGDAQVRLMIDRFAPSEDFRLNLVGKPFVSNVDIGTASIRFGSGLPEQKLRFYGGDLGKNPAWVFISSVRIRPPAEPAAKEEPAEGGGYQPVSFSEADEASVTAIYIDKPLKKPIMLQTGSMKGAFAALRKCTDELLEHWGVDPDRIREVVTWAKPTTRPGYWLRNEDYPAAMLAKGMPGLVQFRLVIGEDGMVSSCHIQQSTNPEGFNDAVCNVLKRRARFEPARDKDGRPVKTYYLNKIHFSQGYP